MKIYNKKAFAAGVCMVGLAELNLTADLAGRTIDMNGIILVVFLLAFGISAVMRSLSKKLAGQDQLEKLDERNQLIEMKSKSKSFRLTQLISFLAMLALMVIGQVSGNRDFITIGTGLAFAFAISMFAEIFAYMYYEEKN